MNTEITAAELLEKLAQKIEANDVKDVGEVEIKVGLTIYCKNIIFSDAMYSNESSIGC